MSVERFRPTVTNVQATAYCGAHPEGEYVKWSDYDAAQQRIAELEAAINLVAQDEYAFFGAQGTLVINCGDTFAYACADAEELPFDKIEEVKALYKQYGYSGLVAWIAKRRQCEPIREWQNEAYCAARAALSPPKDVP